MNEYIIDAGKNFLSFQDKNNIPTVKILSTNEMVKFNNFINWNVMDFNRFTNCSVLISDFQKKRGTLVNEMIIIDNKGCEIFRTDSNKIVSAKFINKKNDLIIESAKIGLMKFDVEKSEFESLGIKSDLYRSEFDSTGNILIPSTSKVGLIHVLDEDFNIDLIKIKQAYKFARLCSSYYKNSIYATTTDSKLVSIESKGIFWETILPPEKSSFAPWNSSIYIDDNEKSIIYNYGNNDYKNPKIHFLFYEMITGKLKREEVVPYALCGGLIKAKLPDGEYVSNGNIVMNFIDMKFRGAQFP